MPKAIYIHIPFCRSICSYCDFCKFVYNEKWVGAYLTGLRNEIKDRYMDEPIKTIYIGGGTPTTLEPEQLKQCKRKAADRYREAGADLVIDSIRELPLAVEEINRRLAKKEAER